MRYGPPQTDVPADNIRPRGRPIIWTTELIRTSLGELLLLCGSPRFFPAQTTFKALGFDRLRRAIQRHGGTERWAAAFGLPAPRRGRPPLHIVELNARDADTTNIAAARVAPLRPSGRPRGTAQLETP